MDAVRKESVQRVVTTMQTPVAKGGNMPVDTGFLRSSLMASTTAMPQIRESGGDTGEPISLVIAGWKSGQTFYAGYTANYASHVEYGSRGRPARRFVGLAVQQWQQIVEQVAREARSRAGG